jgi:hypothetical protein
MYGYDNDLLIMLFALSLMIVQSENHASCAWRALSITLIHSRQKSFPRCSSNSMKLTHTPYTHTTWLQTRKTIHS